MRGSLIVMVVLGTALTAHAFDKSDEPKMKAAASALEKMVGAAAKTRGAKITTEIDWSTFDSSMKSSALDWLGTVTGCGIAARSLDLLCQDDLGKAAAKEVSAVRCVYQSGMEPSHKFENGKLTIGVTVYGAETIQLVTFQESWPKVHAHRLAAGITASARKELLGGRLPGSTALVQLVPEGEEARRRVRHAGERPRNGCRLQALIGPDPVTIWARDPHP